MGNVGTALGIIGILIGAIGVGFAFIVWNGQNTTNSDVDDLIDQVNNLTTELNSLTAELNNLTSTLFVGIWDNLGENMDYTPYDSQDNWLVELDDNKFNNSEYISVSNTNTRITLIKPGWYRLHLSVLLYDIDPNSEYWMRIMKNGVRISHFDYYGTLGTVNSRGHSIDSSDLVYSNGTDYFEINGFSPSDDFYLTIVLETLKQFTIEYVIT